MKNISIGWHTLLACMLSPCLIWADGFRNPPDTAAALGKAGKHIVWVDDASSVFYNPANLVDVPSNQVQLSSLVGYSHANYYGRLRQTETEAPWGLLPNFALAWPLRDEHDLTIGLGIHVPYGRQTRWDEDGMLRYKAPVLSKMMVLDITPALAWRVSDTVSLGAGLDIYYGQLQIKQLLPLPGGRITAEADGVAAGGNAGITWHITPSQRLAFTCRTPFDLEFTGQMQTRNIPRPAVDESDLATTFKYPTILALGYGIQCSESFRIEANLEWLQFSRYENMAIDAGDNNRLLKVLGLADTPQNWTDSWTFGLGADWRFAPRWIARTGYLYLQSPIPDETFAPSMLDVNQSVVSIGCGYQNGQHAIDFAYAVGLFDTRRASSGRIPGIEQGAYEFQGHLAALTYTYAF